VVGSEHAGGCTQRQPRPREVRRRHGSPETARGELRAAARSSAGCHGVRHAANLESRRSRRVRRPCRRRRGANLRRVGARREREDHGRVAAAGASSKAPVRARGLRSAATSAVEPALQLSLLRENRGALERRAARIGERAADAERREPGPTPRTSSFFGELPVTMKPPIRMFSPVPASPRVECSRAAGSPNWDFRSHRRFRPAHAGAAASTTCAV